ncbi:LysR family transcriptional regulator [Gallaecimonas pentaromativorans]|uniref:LysR family transcriptional regulator n=1 Tax=Gallaecimonas pentaromativorans TaxID=584787 RepID=UPI003A8CE453
MKSYNSTEMQFFVLLAQTGSLSGAARALDITPPAATKRLAQLENRLGVRLVNRTTRRISLTQEGNTYLHHARHILAAIAQMEDAVTTAGQTLQGLIRVNSTLGFGRTTIAPLVSRFAKRHPGLEVQLDLTDKPVDLVAQGIDLAVRFGALPDQRLNARKLLSNRRFLCASPRYLAEHGTPAQLADLASHQCIIHRQNEDAFGLWRFIEAQHSEVVKVQGALSSNDGDVVLGWALDGHGILIRSQWDLDKYLKSGRLQQVLPQCRLPDADLYLYYPSKSHQSARVRAFIDFLAEQFAP